MSSEQKTFVINTMSEDTYLELSSRGIISNTQLNIVDDNDTNRTVVASYDLVWKKAGTELKYEPAVAGGTPWLILKNGHGDEISKIDISDFVKEGTLNGIQYCQQEGVLSSYGLKFSIKMPDGTISAVYVQTTDDAFLSTSTNAVTNKTVISGFALVEGSITEIKKTLLGFDEKLNILDKKFNSLEQLKEQMPAEDQAVNDTVKVIQNDIVIYYTVTEEGGVKTWTETKREDAAFIPTQNIDPSEQTTAFAAGSSNDYTRLSSDIRVPSSKLISQMFEKTDAVIEQKADSSALNALANTVSTISSDYLKASDKTELTNAINQKADLTALNLSVQTLETSIGEKADKTDLDNLAQTVNTVSSDYLKLADKTELSDAILTKADTETLNLSVQTLETSIEGKASKDDLALSVENLSGKISQKADTETVAGISVTLNFVSSDYLKLADKTELSDAILTKADKTDLDNLAQTVNTVSSDYLKTSDKTELETKISEKTDKKIVTRNVGTAEIFNEYEGGGAKFTAEDGTTSFVGVNNPASSGGIAGIAGQMYVVNGDSQTKLNMYDGKFCYVKGDKASIVNDDPVREIAVIEDINDVSSVLESEISSKAEQADLELSVGELTKKIPIVDDATIGGRDVAGGYEIYVKCISSLSGDLTGTMASISFVNSSIATNTSYFRGTHSSEEELRLISAYNNDYAFVSAVDSEGNKQFDRYKYLSNEISAQGWQYEYTLNNSSFTDTQWQSINSEITKEKVDKTVFNDSPSVGNWNTAYNKVKDITFGDLVSCSIGHNLSIYTDGGVTKVSAVDTTYDGTNFLAMVEDKDGGRTATTIGSRLSTAEYPASAYTGQYSFADGENCMAYGKYSHAEGKATQVTAMYAHAEGWQTYANGTYSHAEGIQSTAKGLGAHAEGSKAYAEGNYAHAEGDQTSAIGQTSHAEGFVTVAEGQAAHAEGRATSALAFYSNALGTKAKVLSSHVGAFVWNGWDNAQATPDTEYTSKAGGAFQVNPIGGTTGFWVGDENLSSIVSAQYTKSAAYTDGQLSNVISGLWQGLSGYAYQDDEKTVPKTSANITVDDLAATLTNVMTFISAAWFSMNAR